MALVMTARRIATSVKRVANGPASEQLQEGAGRGPKIIGTPVADAGPAAGTVGATESILQQTPSRTALRDCPPGAHTEAGWGRIRPLCGRLMLTTSSSMVYAHMSQIAQLRDAAARRLEVGPASQLQTGANKPEAYSKSGSFSW